MKELKDLLDEGEIAQESDIKPIQERKERKRYYIPEKTISGFIYYFLLIYFWLSIIFVGLAILFVYIILMPYIQLTGVLNGQI